MPGYSLRYDVGDGSSGSAPEFRGILESLEHLDGYESAVVLEEGPVTFGRSAYPSYPVERYRFGSVDLFLEGRLYGAGDVEGRLASLAAALFGPDRDRAAVAEWVSGADGEFVVYAVDRDSGAFAAVNDVLARLPLYYRHTGTGLALSRESGFVLAHPPAVEFDRRAMAQVLLFGYPLGDRTLWAGVDRVPPGSLVRVTPDGSLSVEDLHTWNFDGAPHADRSVEENAERLVALFEDACRTRLRDGGQTVLSLSGGHDSRAIAAVTDRLPLPMVGATFQRGDGESADVRVARSVADALGIDWDVYRLSDPDPERIYRLLRLKNGLNPVGMAFILEFFEALRDRYGGDLTYVTGDGGDKALPDLTPASSLGSVEDVVAHVLESEGAFSPAEAARLTGLAEAEVLDSVREVVADYPESDPAARYVHFLVHERGMNWLTEGEDRNRAYFWSVSPFYSVPFFAYAMGVPDAQKSHNRLYRAFLSELWPPAVEFDDANYGTPMASPRYRLVMYGMDFLERHPRLMDLAATLYRDEVGYEYPEVIHETMTRQVRRCDAVTEYLARDPLEGVLADRGSCDSKQIDRLFTLTSALDGVACGNATPPGEPAGVLARER